MLEFISIISLLTGLTMGFTILSEIFAGHKQTMWIMNIVWPLTALYSDFLGFWTYYKLRLLSTKSGTRESRKRGARHLLASKPPLAKRGSRCDALQQQLAG